MSHVTNIMLQLDEYEDEANLDALGVLTREATDSDHQVLKSITESPEAGDLWGGSKYPE